MTTGTLVDKVMSLLLNMLSRFVIQPNPWFTKFIDINNLRYADDTTLMAESEEELKNFLMKVKEE